LPGRYPMDYSGGKWMLARKSNSLSRILGLTLEQIALMTYNAELSHRRATVLNPA